MNRKQHFGAASAAGVGVLTLGLVMGLAAGNSGHQPNGEQEMQLPPGWTMEDMMACVQAGTPGEHQQWLAEAAGSWQGSGSMWMGPGGEEAPFEVEMTITTIMDGRYTRTEMNGEFPGMGPYNGFGITGYDNVASEFVADWIDNHSTGIMNGKGERTDDKTLTWTFRYMCPVTTKPTTMRQVEKIEDADTRTMEMFGIDPISGEEYRIMRIEFERN